MPDLVQSLHYSKGTYRDAAIWLRENTPKEARVASFDRRIWLLSERAGGNNELGYDFVVRNFESEDPEWTSTAWRIAFDRPVDPEDPDERIVIYDCRR